MDANNVTSDTFSLASIPYRENPNAICASEKLENTDELFDAVANMTINDVRYELNTTIASDAKVEFASDQEKLFTL